MVAFEGFDLLKGSWFRIVDKIYAPLFKLLA
jgi:hypothetical protein